MVFQKLQHQVPIENHPRPTRFLKAWLKERGQLGSDDVGAGAGVPRDGKGQRLPCDLCGV